MNDSFASAISDFAAKLNAADARGGLTRFQRALLEAKPAIVISPFTTKPATLTANWHVPGKGMLYHFSCEPSFFVITSMLHRGHPVSAVVCGDGIFPAADPIARDTELEALAARLLVQPATIPDAFSAGWSPTMLIGNPNFAHYMWNEFSTLHDAINVGARFNIISVADPLGATAILAHQNQLPLRRLARRRELEGWLAFPTLLAGTRYCAEKPKAALLDLLELPHRPIGDGMLRLYCSTRQTGRAALNQYDFLRAIIRRLSKAYDRFVLTLDGFSYPEDFTLDVYDDLRKWYAHRADEERLANAEFIASLDLRPNQKVRDATGCSLRDALQIISTCDYYVTHSGSQQHKAAWFRPIPGFMHGNRTSLTPGALRWLGEQVHGTFSPASPTPDSVEDFLVRAMPVGTDRNRDYRIIDCEETADKVMWDLAAKMHARAAKHR